MHMTHFSTHHLVMPSCQRTWLCRGNWELQPGNSKWKSTDQTPYQQTTHIRRLIPSKPDHLPILITVETDIKLIPNEDCTFINFKKADWIGFEKRTDKKIFKHSLSNYVYAGEITFRRIVNKAVSNFIPPGRRLKEIFPEVPTASVEKIINRDRIVLLKKLMKRLLHTEEKNGT